MSGLEIGLLAVIVIGLAGIVIPLLPGSILVAAAILIWALDRGQTDGWLVFAGCAALIAVGAVAKYLIPGRRLQRSGVSQRSLLMGAVLGVAGFFVIPFVGLPLGFVAGVYVSELQRGPARDAWPATVAALRAVGLGIVIELAFASLAALAWAVAAIAW